MKSKKQSLRRNIEEILYKEVTSFSAVSYEDLTDKLLQVFTKTIEDAKPEKYEQNITRTQDGDLMCDTCGSDVFGGICACETINQVVADYSKNLGEALP